MGDARVDRATALAEMGNIDDAVDAYKLILAVDPRSAAAHYNLGLTLMRDGRFDQAIASFDSGCHPRAGIRRRARFKRKCALLTGSLRGGSGKL